MIKTLKLRIRLAWNEIKLRYWKRRLDKAQETNAMLIARMRAEYPELFVKEDE